MGRSPKFFHHYNCHKIWSRKICNMHMYDSYMSHNLKIFKKSAWLITHDLYKIIAKTLHNMLDTAIRFYLLQKILFSFLLVPIMVFIRFLSKIFKKSLRLRTYVGGSDFLCINFIFLVLSNKIGEKMIWVLLLIHRFISDRHHSSLCIPIQWS